MNNIIGFELFSAGDRLGATPIREQAVNAAKTYASKNRVDVSVVAHMEDGSTREVVYKPDGYVDKLWARAYIDPVPGEVYRNRNGVSYKCLDALPEHSALMERVTDGYTFTAHGVQQYKDDGNIEWNYSTGGGWPHGIQIGRPADARPAPRT